MKKSNILDLHPSRFSQVKVGAKIATLRQGNVRCSPGLGTVENSETKEKVSVNIKFVACCAMNSITQEMVSRLNYQDKEQMTSVMKEVYPGIESSSTVTYVEFEVVS